MLHKNNVERLNELGSNQRKRRTINVHSQESSFKDI
jgi:hypothetical protein